MRLFYIKVLGFKEDYFYVSRNTKGLKTVFLQKGNTYIELLKFDDSNVINNKTTGYSHLSFTVDDVDKEEKRLIKLGVKISKSSRDTGDGYRELEIKDPEGNVIEISKRIKRKPKYPVKAVIFDFDGTIIDSEENYYEADRLLMKRFGIDFTMKMKEEFIGVGNQAMMNELKTRYKLDIDVDEMIKLKNNYYIDLARKNTKIYKGMFKLIKILFNKNIPMAIASGTTDYILEELVTNLDLKKYFNVIISADDIGKSKPEPDIFLATAKRLNVNPENCIVIEDSKHGVEAAKRAFMRCIAIPYLNIKPLEDAFLLADMLFENGMKEFSYKKVLKMINSS
jgi:HAD superfamily hydrolase (TIGR01509 family)